MITGKEVKSIAQELEMGMKVYLNRKTLEYKSILDWDDMYGDTNFWEGEMEKIESEWDDYVVLSKMETRESFRIMEDFIDEIEDEKFRDQLISILNNRRPFANFKANVEGSAYRQQWFDFRLKKYEEHVIEQLEFEGIEVEDVEE